ncbi:MAG: hypothetical protein IPK07_24620 [Deltaproteobacteria bacterium]|nr:hypothetical protein [Deltaproteobacteria bacterium]
MKPRDTPERRKIRARLRSYEAKLRREKETFGAYHDGAGKRYLLGPLHLSLDDLDGAMEAFRWFAREFPDDCGEPGHLVLDARARPGGGTSWRGQQAAADDAEQPARPPHLLGYPVARLDLWHSSSDAQPDYGRDPGRVFRDVEPGRTREAWAPLPLAGLPRRRASVTSRSTAPFDSLRPDRSATGGVAEAFALAE